MSQRVSQHDWRLLPLGHSRRNVGVEELMLLGCIRQSTCHGATAASKRLTEACKVKCMMHSSSVLQVESFEAAVTEWNDGKVNDWNSYTNTDWTYEVDNPCGTDDDGSLPKDTSTELERDRTALGAEIEEQDTFASYETATYAASTSQLGTVSQNASGTDCQVAVTVSFKGSQVC